MLEGDKVKLHVNKIRGRPDWETMQHEYKDFVENNADAVFTVEYDEEYQDKPNLVLLKEDISKQKWLFFDGDLLVLDESDGEFKEMYRLQEN